MKKKQKIATFCQDTQNGVERPEKLLRKMSVWMFVHPCVRVLRLRKIQTSISQELLTSADRIAIWYEGKASVPFFSIISVATDYRIHILRSFEFFLKSL